jgi:hypothetical protein
MVISTVKKQTGDIAKKAARQILEEPIEILKKAPAQISELEKTIPSKIPPSEAAPAVSPQYEAKIKAQGQRQIQALEAELKAISEQKARQQEVPPPQPPVPEKPLVEPAPRPSRRFLPFGKKAQAERQKTRVERPLPPSG